MPLPGIGLASSVAAAGVRAQQVRGRLTRRRGRTEPPSAVAVDEDNVEHVPDVDQVELSDAVRDAAERREEPPERREAWGEGESEGESRPRLDVTA